MSISQKWRLDNLLSSDNPEQFCKNWLERLEQFYKVKDLIEAIELWQNLSGDLREFSSYAECLFSEDVSNVAALSLSQRALELETLFSKATSLLGTRLMQQEQFETLLQNPRLQEISFALRYRRDEERQKMPQDMEALVTDLALHGYHGWQELYKQAISNMRVQINEGEVQGNFSYGQLDNFLSHPKREIRQAAFLGLEKACKEHEEIYAQALRSIVGFRLKLYAHRGWKSPFQEALWNNRLQESSLTSMWEAVSKAAPLMCRFLDEKAKLMGLKALAWYDLEAPLGDDAEHSPFDEAQKLIVELFSEKSAELGQFAKKAFDERWIEAENRTGKAPGGFCTPLPKTQESRIFMTYAGNMHNVLVLAHELGHAYHNQVCYELPEMSQNYPMSLAECASTTCELLVLNGLVSKAKSRQERKRLFYEKAKRSAVFLLNIRARFLFESSLFSRIENEYLSPKKLSQMMQEAQAECYGGRLEVYHPYFWISKIHFYLTGTPSYNFPYTFGYLLSLAILDLKDLRGFLKDTGQMTCEALVKKHLGKDLNDPLFWQKTIDLALADIEEFLAL